MAQSDAGLARTIIHEGAHTTLANRRLREAYLDRGGLFSRIAAGARSGFAPRRTFNQAHQTSFKAAARQLFAIPVP